jgi:hypothetical protein
MWYSTKWENDKFEMMEGSNQHMTFIEVLLQHLSEGTE